MHRFSRLILAAALLFAIAVPRAARAIVSLNDVSATENIVSCSTTPGLTHVPDGDVCDVVTLNQGSLLAGLPGFLITGFAIGNPLATQVAATLPGWTATLATVDFGSFGTEQAAIFQTTNLSDALSNGFDLAESGSLATGGAASPYIIYGQYADGDTTSCTSSTSSFPSGCTFAADSAPTPEPGFFALTGIGFGGIVWFYRRRRQAR